MKLTFELGQFALLGRSDLFKSKVVLMAYSMISDVVRSQADLIRQLRLGYSGGGDGGDDTSGSEREIRTPEEYQQLLRRPHELQIENERLRSDVPMGAKAERDQVLEILRVQQENINLVEENKKLGRIVEFGRVETSREVQDLKNEVKRLRKRGPKASMGPTLQHVEDLENEITRLKKIIQDSEDNSVQVKDLEDEVMRLYAITSGSSDMRRDNCTELLQRQLIDAQKKTKSLEAKLVVDAQDDQTELKRQLRDKILVFESAQESSAALFQKEQQARELAEAEVASLTTAAELQQFDIEEKQVFYDKESKKTKRLVEDLQQQLETGQAQEQYLNDKIASLISMRNRDRKFCGTSRKECDNLRDQVADSEKLIAELRENLNEDSDLDRSKTLGRLETDNTKLKEKLDNTEKDLKDMQEKLDTCREHRKESAERQRTLYTENQKLKQWLDEEREAALEVRRKARTSSESGDDKQEELQRLYDECKKHREKLSNELEDVSTRCEDLGRMYEIVEKRYEDCNDHRQRASAKIIKLNAEIEELEDKKMDFEEQLAETQGDLEKVEEQNLYFSEEIARLKKGNEGGAAVNPTGALDEDEIEDLLQEKFAEEIVAHKELKRRYYALKMKIAKSESSQRIEAIRAKYPRGEWPDPGDMRTDFEIHSSKTRKLDVDETWNALPESEKKREYTWDDILKDIKVKDPDYRTSAQTPGPHFVGLAQDDPLREKDPQRGVDMMTDRSTPGRLSPLLGVEDADENEIGNVMDSDLNLTSSSDSDPESELD